MDVRRIGGEENSADGNGAEGIATAVMNYDRKTGDGKWLTNTITILAAAIKETQAESTAEPSKSMRSVDGADRAGLRPDNCQR